MNRQRESRRGARRGTATDPQTGWFLVGPMLYICIEHAPTGDDARAHLIDRWVAAVIPTTTTPQRCAVCERDV